MLVTVFVFIGIEGASVYSRFAKERTDVGMATIIGFIIVTIADGAGHAAALRGAAARRHRRPAPAVDGRRCSSRSSGRGARSSSASALIVSVLGAYLAWSLICAEVMFAAAQVEGHAGGVRQGEQEQGAGRGALGDQHHHPAHRDHDVLVARRVLADAEPDQRDDADPVPVRRRLRPDDRPARRDLRRAAGRAHSAT